MPRIKEAGGFSPRFTFTYQPLYVILLVFHSIVFNLKELKCVNPATAAVSTGATF